MNHQFEHIEIREVPEMSDWVCYLFGGTKGNGIRWNPVKGTEPNWFIRWMMKICFGCTWVREIDDK